jgi:hypothetical protein
MIPKTRMLPPDNCASQHYNGPDLRVTKILAEVVSR